MSSWLDGMGSQEARFQPGDHACLVTWKSSFFPLYQLHSEILEKLEQAIVFRKGSPICMEEFRDLRVFIHVNSDDYLERHDTEETADWCNHETRTSSVEQWIEHRPCTQLVPGPTKNLICANKWKHYQLRCVVYDIQRAPYGGNYGPISHASWEKRFLIWGWQDELDRVSDLVEWSQDYSSILCLPISDPVPKPRVMLKALHSRVVDMIRRFMPLSLFPGNAIWHPDDIEQITATPPTRSLAPSAIKLAVSKLDPSSTIRHGTKISAQSSVLPPAAETQLLELQNQSLCSPLSRD